ncbi:MAG: VOC family protein [Bryobacteraceae bacterium]
MRLLFSAAMLSAVMTLPLAIPASAQLAPQNIAGVTMGHVHLNVKDVAAQKHFWVDIMGGKPMANQQLEMIEFPGVYILLRQQTPTAPPDGSIADHFGFVVKDWNAWLEKWRANGLKMEQSGVNPNQRYVTAPDGIRLEVFGDPDLPVPVQMNHIHFYPPKADIGAMQAWYAKMFGGIIGKRESVARPGNFIDTDDLPGVNLSISPSETHRAATIGRTIDHIGFEVKNLPEFVKTLEAQGIKMDEAVRPANGSTATRVAYLTDPWGTRIELTEGLPPAVPQLP